MAHLPLTLLPDSDDGQALQAWVDATADDVPLRLLLDTGTHTSALPRVEPLTSRTSSVVAGGQGVFGAPVDETGVKVGVLRAGPVVARDLLVTLQPPDWPRPALLGMDVLGAHRCVFRFDDEPRIEVDGARPAVDWLPLQSDPHRTPHVQVRWGQTVASAVWDTGAGVTVVDRSWALQHPDLVVAGSGSATGRGTDVTGAEAEHAWGTLAAGTIGDRQFADQTCAIVDFSAMNARLAVPIEVILGLPLIAQASWCMDFAGQRWALLP